VAKSAKSAERRERLAVALRENLKRRKAKARALSGTEDDAPTGAKTGEADLPPADPKKASKSD
jgi:hypothetical protein